mgnify:CR=1 FL=1
MRISVVRQLFLIPANILTYYYREGTYQGPGCLPDQQDTAEESKPDSFAFVRTSALSTGRAYCPPNPEEPESCKPTQDAEQSLQNC